MLVAGLLFQVMQPETGKAAARGERSPRSRQNAANTQAYGKNRKRSVARVNGQLISYDQLAEECVARYGSKVLEGIINRTMIEQAFADKAGCADRAGRRKGNSHDRQKIQSGSRSMAADDADATGTDARSISPRCHLADVGAEKIGRQRSVDHGTGTQRGL